jgi:hypothetical protein
MDGKHGFIYPSRIGLKITIRIKYFYLKKYQPEGWYLALVGRQGLKPRTKGL